MDTTEEEETRQGLTLARLAEIMAHLRHFPASASPEVLARLDLTEAQWAAVLDAWTDELAEESARENTDLARRFGVAFARTRERLTSEQPVLASLGRLREEVADGDAAPTSPSPERSAVLAIVEMPTAVAAVRARRASGAVSPWAADLVGTCDGASLPAAPALPFDPTASPAVSARAGGVVHARMRSLTDLGGTLEPPSTPAGPALPFQRARPAAAPPVELSLEQYASLCVELAAEPDATDAVLRRYQVSHEQRGALDDYWHRRFGDEPGTWMAWDRAYKEYQGWYVAARGSKPRAG